MAISKRKKTAVNFIQALTVELFPSIAADEIIQGGIRHPWRYAKEREGISLAGAALLRCHMPLFNNNLRISDAQQIQSHITDPAVDAKTETAIE